MKKLKNENHLKQHYFNIVQTTQKEHKLKFKPRFLNKIYAKFHRYFWLKCHKCGKNFGGHEFYGSSDMVGVCPTCTLEIYNRTGKFDEKN